MTYQFFLKLPKGSPNETAEQARKRAQDVLDGRTDWPEGAEIVQEIQVESVRMVSAQMTLLREERTYSQSDMARAWKEGHDATQRYEFTGDEEPDPS